LRYETTAGGVIEEALEEERTRLMLANSMLGCVQIALDPEAISVAPAVYFPEVLELARQLTNTSVRRLEYAEIRRLLHSPSRKCEAIVAAQLQRY
jgi:hypothetical protein